MYYDEIFVALFGAEFMLTDGAVPAVFFTLQR